MVKKNQNFIIALLVIVGIVLILNLGDALPFAIGNPPSLPNAYYGHVIDNGVPVTFGIVTCFREGIDKSQRPSIILPDGRYGFHKSAVDMFGGIDKAVHFAVDFDNKQYIPISSNADFVKFTNDGFLIADGVLICGGADTMFVDEGNGLIAYPQDVRLEMGDIKRFNLVKGSCTSNIKELSCGDLQHSKVKTECSRDSLGFISTRITETFCKTLPLDKGCYSPIEERNLFRFLTRLECEDFEEGDIIFERFIPHSSFETCVRFKTKTEQGFKTREECKASSDSDETTEDTTDETDNLEEITEEEQAIQDEIQNIINGNGRIIFSVILVIVFLLLLMNLGKNEK